MDVNVLPSINKGSLLLLYFLITSTEVIRKVPVQVQSQVQQKTNYLHISYIHHFSGAPRGAFQQPVYNKYKVRWLRVLARPLQAVHNGYFCLRH